MGHFCEECGQACYCDQDDIMGPQPLDCSCYEDHEEKDADCLGCGVCKECVTLCAENDPNNQPAADAKAQERL